MGKIERMREFFASRVETYERHMLENVGGCREGYVEMARLIPTNARKLLDLGCGTGLELDEIFPRHRDLQVTGIDLSPEMMAILRKKHAHRHLALICKDYFQANFPENFFDVAISFESLHHFSPAQKTQLYKKIFRALRHDGLYIECDYMANDEAEETRLQQACAELREQLSVPDGEFLHFDAPCTAETQIKCLRQAGFLKVQEVWRHGDTVMLTARKF